MAVVSEAVAARSWASSPITNMRSALWPTSGARFGPSRPARASSHSANDSHDQSTPSSNTASGSCSIWPNMRDRRPRCDARSGASDSEQLPVTTVVTPCSSTGVASGSQLSWASKCVWMSMKPGATTRSVASTAPSCRPAASTRPMWAMRPSRTPTSAR